MAFTRKRYYNLIKNPNTELLKNKKQLIKNNTHKNSNRKTDIALKSHEMIEENYLLLKKTPNY